MNSHKYLFVPSLLSIILGGCTIGPNYTPPKVNLPEHYLNTHSLNTLNTTSDIKMWWENFNDIQLTKYIKLALQQNLDISQAYTRVEQAQAGLLAANASLSPSGTIEAQAAKNYQSLETPLGKVLDSMPNFNRNSHAYDTNLSASWELDIFGGLRRDREATLAKYEAANANVSAAQLIITAETANIYINIRGLQSKLDIASKELQAQEDILSLTQMLYKKGLTSEFQVKKAKANTSEAKATIFELSKNLEVAMNALDVVLGTTPRTYRSELIHTKPIPTPSKITGTGTPNDLLRRRPDLIVAERQLAASNARIGSAIAEYYPKISLSGLIGSSTMVGSDLFSSSSNQITGLVGLQWRLFDFKRIKSEINLARGKEAEMLLAYQSAVLHATEDVENSLSNLSQQEKKLITLQNGESELQQTEQISIIAYQKGLNSKFEVLQTHLSKLQLSENRAQAQIDLALATVSVYKSLGGGWS